MGNQSARRNDFSWRREGRRVGHFLSWLGGVDPAGFRAEACLFATLLPEGLRDASIGAVGRAVAVAVLRHGAASGGVVRFFFSSLPAEDQDKALVVMDTLISIIPAREVPALVRVAVLTRPTLALPLARAAMARVPAEAGCIWNAAESVVVGLADPESKADLFSAEARNAFLPSDPSNLPPPHPATPLLYPTDPPKPTRLRKPSSGQALRLR